MQAVNLLRFNKLLHLLLNKLFVCKYQRLQIPHYLILTDLTFTRKQACNFMAYTKLINSLTPTTIAGTKDQSTRANAS